MQNDINRFKDNIREILPRNGIKHKFSDLFGADGKKTVKKYLRDIKLKDSERY